MTLKANRVTWLRRTALPQGSQGPDGACPPALCSLNGVGPQTQFVLWKGIVGRSHIVGLWSTLWVWTTKVCCNACGRSYGR